MVEVSRRELLRWHKQAEDELICLRSHRTEDQLLSDLRNIEYLLGGGENMAKDQPQKVPDITDRQHDAAEKLMTAILGEPQTLTREKAAEIINELRRGQEE